MADEEEQQGEVNNTVEGLQRRKNRKKKIRKEVEKLQFYVEDVDELFESEYLGEILNTYASEH